MAGCGCGAKKKRKGNLGSSGVEHIERARLEYTAATEAARKVAKAPCGRTGAAKLAEAVRHLTRAETHMFSSGSQRTSPEGQRVNTGPRAAAMHAVEAAGDKAAACRVSLSGVGRRRRKRRR